MAAIVIVSGIISAIGGFVAARRMHAAEPQSRVAGLIRHLVNSHSRRTIVILWVVMVTAFSAAAANDGLCEYLPLRLQRDIYGLLWLIGMVPLAAGIAWLVTAAVLCRDPQQRLVIQASTVIICLTFWHAVQSTISGAAALTDRRTEDGVILQSTGYSCVAACVANVATLDGQKLTEKEAAELLGTSASGTSNGGIRYTLRQLGIPVHSPPRSTEPHDLSPPAIVSIDHPATGPESHAVLLNAIHTMASDGSASQTEQFGDNVRLEIWDPLVGIRMLSIPEFQAVWHGAAFECRVRGCR